MKRKEKEKEILAREIDNLNEEITLLSHQLNEIFNINCSFGVCLFNPEVDSIQEKMKEVQERKELLETINRRIEFLTGKKGN